MNLISMYNNAQKLLDAARTVEGESKAAHLRGGNSGCIVGGDIVGACPRLAHLRSKGYDTPIDEATRLMFSGGNANEFNWLEKMTAYTKANGLILKAESDYPLTWTLASGTVVSGSPDFIVLEGLVPLMGVELKCVMALNTYINTIVNGEPKSENLIQAAHYLYMLRLKNESATYKLCYTSYVNFPVAGFYASNLPKLGAPGSHYCEYNAKGIVKTARPAMAVYDIDITPAGIIRYKREDAETWTDTILTQQGLLAFYDAVDSMERDRDLGPRPNQITALGKKPHYSICDYCSCGPSCSAFDAD